MPCHSEVACSQSQRSTALQVANTRVRWSRQRTQSHEAHTRSTGSRHAAVMCHVASKDAASSDTSLLEASRQRSDVTRRAVPYSSHSWQWRGYKINYVVAGCGAPVVLVHGFGANVRHWRKNIPELAKSYKVYAIDLLGFGASQKPVIDYSIELWRDLVVDFTREFVDGAAVFVGNSVGSLTCLAAAAALPQHSVAGVVLLNCAGGMNNKARADDWRVKLVLPLFLLIDAALKNPRIGRSLFDRFRQRESLRNVLRSVYCNSDAVDDELVELLYGPSCDDGALETFVSVITGPPGPRPEDLVSSIAAPMLVLWGDNDPFTPMDGPVGRFFRALPLQRADFEFAVLRGVGHCPHDDDAHAVHEQLMPWLARVLPSSSQRSTPSSSSQLDAALDANS